VLNYGKKTLGIEVKSNTEKTSAINREKFLSFFPAARLILVGNSGISFEEFTQIPLPELFK
jgi:hypothetical protein